MQDRVDVFDILRAVASQWKLVAAITVMTTALAVSWALVATPVYRAGVLVSPVDSGQMDGGLGSLVGQFGGLASMAGLDFQQNRGKEEALAVLTSRRFTEDFVSSNGLLPVWFEENWDAVNQDWKESDPERIPSMEDAHRLLIEQIRRIEEDPESGLITISIDWKDRDLAANWANLMVRQLNQDIRSSAISEAQKSIEYLTSELESTSIVGVQQAIFSLIEGQVNIVMLANVREEYAFKTIDPAIAPDVDRFVWPRRALLVAVGFLLGVLGGALLALMRSAALMTRPETSEVRLSVDG